jgi:hypothetical protein
MFLFTFFGVVSDASAKRVVFQELTITFDCPDGLRIAGTITAQTENGTVSESIGINDSFEKKIKASAVSINFHAVADKEYVSVQLKKSGNYNYNLRPLFVGVHDRISNDNSFGVRISDKNGRILKKTESVLIPDRYQADPSLISFTHRQEISLSY